jgi:cation:H+ antiporter
MLALLFALGLFAVGTLLLVLGADWFLDGAGDLARTLGASALVLGVVLAGLEPEEMLTASMFASFVPLVWYLPLQAASHRRHKTFS